MKQMKLTGTCAKMISVLGLVLATIAAAGCATPTQTSSVPARPTNEQTVMDANSFNYQLGPGDRVKITVFGEPNMSGEFQLDNSGAIAMPLAGEINVSGLDVRGLEKTVHKALDGRFLVDPKISAQILTYRPYYVYGEVREPGEFAFVTDLTVVNAVARAGGFTPRAKQGVVFIRRENSEKEERVKLSPDLKVYPGDTVRIGVRLF